MTRSTGGQAFPGTDYNPYSGLKTFTPGMSLRDWFAGQALQMEWSGRWDDAAQPITCETVAKYAYAIADAMIKERES